LIQSHLVTVDLLLVLQGLRPDEECEGSDDGRDHGTDALQPVGDLVSLFGGRDACRRIVVAFWNVEPAGSGPPQVAEPVQGVGFVHPGIIDRAGLSVTSLSGRRPFRHDDGRPPAKVAGIVVFRVK
jgi:hypothetical protein